MNTKSHNKIERPKGLESQHYGFMLRNNFSESIHFSPSKFAMAWIRTQTYDKKREVLDEIVTKILEGEYSRDEVPYLYDAVTNKEEGRFGIEDLENLAKKYYGTSKIIKKEAVLAVNLSEEKGTGSPKDLVSMRIDSKKKRSAKNPEYSIELINPFISSDSHGYNINELRMFRTGGGSKHTTKNSAKTNPFSNRVERERKAL